MMKEKLNVLWKDYDPNAEFSLVRWKLKQQKAQRVRKNENLRRVYEKCFKHFEERKSYPNEGERQFLDILKLIIENDWTINFNDLAEIIRII